MRLLNQLFIRLLIILAVFSGVAKASLREISADELSQIMKSLQQTPYAGGAQPRVSSEVLPDIRRFDLELPVDDHATHALRKVNVPLYLPNFLSGYSYPIVLISATIEGVSPVEITLATRLAEKGFGAAILDVNSFPYNPGKTGIQQIYADSLFAVHAFRTMIDWVESHPMLPNFDFSGRHPILAYGASNGTLTVTSATAADPRILGSVIVAAIGDIPNIYTTSKLQKIITMRDESMKMENLGADQIEKFFEENIPGDPVFVAPKIAPERIYQFRSMLDTTVPTVDQLELWNALHQPNHVDIMADHAPSILSSVTLHFSELLDFYEARSGFKRVN